MSKQDRLPKEQYFLKRYKEAVANGLTSKAEYYKSRLVQMDKWTQINEYTNGKLSRTEISTPDSTDSIVFYSW